MTYHCAGCGLLVPLDSGYLRLTDRRHADHGRAPDGRYVQSLPDLYFHDMACLLRWTRNDSEARALSEAGDTL